MRERIAAGFTLLEVFIALAIVCILVSLGIPVYQHHLVKVKRHSAQMALLDLANQMESYYSRHKTYKGARVSQLSSSKMIIGRSYQLAIHSVNEHAFVIKAIPRASQAIQDSRCGSLTYNQRGQKGVSGSASIQECWG